MATVCHDTTLAQRQAAANLRANLAALSARGDRRPGAAARVGPDEELVFARDGTLTVLGADGRFAGGCSVPSRAARAQLADFAVAGSAACLLAPSHAAEVRAVLDRLRPEQALIVLLPDDHNAGILLHCDDFSTAINRGRLWIACGEAWAERLRQILIDQPGLAVPTQFVRLKTMPQSATEALIPPAQAIFAEVTQRRAAELDAASRAPWVRSGAKVCVVGGSRFRLWNDAGHELAAIVSGEGEFDCHVFDVDDPCRTTPLALAGAVRAADAVVAADVCRGDVPPAVAPREMPWIAWLTRPRAIPAFASAGLRDRLIVVDPAMRRAATDAGWPAATVAVAGWPRDPSPAVAAGRELALVANLPPLEPPAQLENFSSHRLLWEWLASHLQRDPLCAFDAAEALVERGASQLGLKPADLPVATYVEGLIVPGYALGVATILLRAGLPLRLYGEGWDRIDTLAPHHAGPVRTREQFRSAVAGARAVVRHVPASSPLAVDYLPVPAVGQTAAGQDARALVSSVRSATAPARSLPPPLAPSLIRSLLAPP